jgi:Holliday junction resolvasome RuvABC endonuclease subunit
MRILSFDQSSTLSGFCLYDGQILDSGTIDKHKIKDSDVRIAEMGAAICNKIDELRPSLVVIEGIQNQSSIATVIYLARLQGMILGHCYAHKMDIEILAPSKWRSRLAFKQGKGTKRDELKQQAMGYIADEFSIDVDIDQAEAICIAVAADKMFDDEI